MPEGEDYSEELQRLSTLRADHFGLWATFVPVVGAVACIAGLVFGAEVTAWVAVGVALIWMVLFAVVSDRLSSARCPRCGKRFFARRAIASPTARRCRHCKLPLPSETPREQR